jgi:hypothetical protein
MRLGTIGKELLDLEERQRMAKRLAMAERREDEAA